MKLWAEHEMPMHKLLVWTVTLTFDLATWFLHMTHCLVDMMISSNNFQIPPIFGMKLWVGHDSGMPKLKVSAMTLTFNLGTWFLHATHHLLTMIISPK